MRDHAVVQYSLSALIFLLAVAALVAFRIGLFDDLRRRFAPAAASTAERVMSHPDAAWRLVDDAALWPLWMPSVSELRDRVRPIRPQMRLQVALRDRRGPVMVRHDGPAHVVVEAYDARTVLGWQLVVGDRVDRYRLERAGGRFLCTSTGGVPAATVLEQLDRETSWAGEPGSPAQEPSP